MPYTAEQNEMIKALENAAGDKDISAFKKSMEDLETSGVDITALRFDGGLNILHLAALTQDMDSLHAILEKNKALSVGESLTRQANNDGLNAVELIIAYIDLPLLFGNNQDPSMRHNDEYWKNIQVINAIVNADPDIVFQKCSNGRVLGHTLIMDTNPSHNMPEILQVFLDAAPELIHSKDENGKTLLDKTIDQMGIMGNHNFHVVLDSFTSLLKHGNDIGLTTGNHKIDDLNIVGRIDNALGANNVLDDDQFECAESVIQEHLHGAIVAHAVASRNMPLLAGCVADRKVPDLDALQSVLKQRKPQHQDKVFTHSVEALAKQHTDIDLYPALRTFDTFVYSGVRSLEARAALAVQKGIEENTLSPESRDKAVSLTETGALGNAVPAYRRYVLERRSGKEFVEENTQKDRGYADQKDQSPIDYVHQIMNGDQGRGRY